MQGPYVRNAQVKLGEIVLPYSSWGASGSYHANLPLTSFPNPFNFTITIPPTQGFPPYPPKSMVVIHATQIGQFHGIRLISPADGQVFHRSQTNQITVQWQVLPGPAPVIMTLEDTEGSPFHYTQNISAGVTQCTFSLAKIPLSVSRFRIHFRGPAVHHLLDGPVTPDSYVGLDSRCRVVVKLLND